MRSLFTSLILASFSTVSVLSRYCRFAPHFTIDMLLNDKYSRDEFVSLYMQGEADFLELAGLDHDFAVSYDGHGLHVESGELLP